MKTWKKTLSIVFLASLLVGGVYFYTQGTIVEPPEEELITYTPNYEYPDFFEDFKEDEGYEPEHGDLTKIGDYRIATDEVHSTYDDEEGNLQKDCAVSMTVYEDTDSGLNKIREIEEENDPDDIELEELTVKPMTQNRFSFYRCEWIGTSFDYEPSGQFEFEANVPNQSTTGETLTSEVNIENQFDYPVSGTVNLKFCSEGPFNTKSCTERNVKVEKLKPQATSTEQVNISLDRVKGNVTLKPTFKGTLVIGDSWTGVNWDCDGDSTIERADMCDGFHLKKQGKEISVEVTPELPDKEPLYIQLLNRITEELKFW